MSGELYSAEALFQDSLKSHLRWNIFTSKNNLKIIKKNNELSIKTLDRDLFEKIVRDLKLLDPSPQYIKGIKIERSVKAEDVPTIRISLTAKNVEIFNFYKDRDKKLILDFWKEDSEINKTVSQVEKLKNQAVIKNNRKASLKTKSASSNKGKKASIKKIAEKKSQKIFDFNVNKRAFRDYRYGAALIWNYDLISPQLPKIIQLDRKTAEYFYPIKDRNFEKSEKEAHIQLAINLYKKKKWGLMGKSLELYTKKYGSSDNVDIVEYLKANSIIRNNLTNLDKGNLKIALNMYSNIAERGTNYDLTKAIYKYLINSHIQSKGYVQALQISKKFYIESKANFDIEESLYAAEAILHNLAQLNQIKKLRQVLQEKTIIKLVPKQTMIAYEIYSLIQTGRTKEALKYFKKIKGQLKAPIHSSILFNIAEAKFRVARFEESIKMFDNFIDNYSFKTQSSQARIRIAQMYELLGKNDKQTVELYKNAINHSQDPEITYEAKIRYVAIRSIRKKNITKEDREVRVFLERENNKLIIANGNLKKLLWQVRLRTFIVDGKLKKALAYLTAIPLTSMKLSEERVFGADGAEIIYGILFNHYKKGEYSALIKVWEMFKDKYVKKVADDPILNYIVCYSYIKLNLYEGFDNAYSAFKILKGSPSKTFPIWITRKFNPNSQTLLVELDIVKNLNLKNYKEASNKINELKKGNPGYSKLNYYNAVISYEKKEYAKSAELFERYLVGSDGNSIYDVNELVTLVSSYTDSIYQIGKLDRYRKVANAILSDTTTYSPNNPLIKSVRERINYLSIEILAGKSKLSDSLVLEAEITKFKKIYKKSSYGDRLNYLLGVAFVKNKKTKEGVDIFNKLINNDSTSTHVKELARSELSLIKLKKRTI